MRVTKICRVCGKEYEACMSCKPKGVAYRWQDVACSPEHGAEYLAAIIASRSTDSNTTVTDDLNVD